MPSNNFNNIPAELRALITAPVRAISGIYIILNKTDGRFYLGSSSKILKRWRLHKYELNNNKHNNKYLQRSYNKCGTNNFEFIIIEAVEPIAEKLENREQFWLDLTQCYKRDIGYNILEKAYSVLGFKFSHESLAKLSAAKKGFKHTEEAKSKMRFKKPAMSERMTGNTYNKGRKYEGSELERLRLQPRKLDKWPHEKGSRCPCFECRRKKLDRDNFLRRNKSK